MEYFKTRGKVKTLCLSVFIPAPQTRNQAQVCASLNRGGFNPNKPRVVLRSVPRFYLSLHTTTSIYKGLFNYKIEFSLVNVP